MKTSIETVGGKPCTVIRKPFDVEWVREQLAMGIPVSIIPSWVKKKIQPPFMVALSFEPSDCSYLTIHREDLEVYDESELLENSHILCILPALPRRPKPEDAQDFSLYNAHGIYPIIEVDGGDHIQPQDTKGKLFVTEGWEYRLVNGRDFIHHATVNGERVEIAIREDV